MAIFFYANSGPEYGENLPKVSGLPSYASEVSYYKSKQVKVYEFRIKADDFKTWAGQSGMSVQRVTAPKVLSRYKAYIPPPKAKSSDPLPPDGIITIERFQQWQHQISITVNSGMIARGRDEAVAIYDVKTQKAYFEYLISF